MKTSVVEPAEDLSLLFPDNRREGETVLRQAQLVMLRMLRVIDHICRKHGIRYWLCSGTLLGAVRYKGFIPWDDDLDISMMREDYEKFLRIAPSELPADLFLQTRESDPDYDYLPLPCKLRDLNSLIIALGQENKKYARGLFVDIFPMDRYHKKHHPAYLFERTVKWCNNFICRGLDAEFYKHQSRKSLFLSFFKPLFYILKRLYDKMARRKIEANRSLIDGNCLIGRGLDIIWYEFFAYDEIFPLTETEFEGGTFYAPHNKAAYLTRFYGKNYMTPPPAEKRHPGHSVVLKPILEKE
ncbi:LPS biosynthesis protein [Bacteroidales bacterium Barb7]|nr:LPS biosynthesis protein [Bacteroidales bacterium Barb7]